jgi:uncharacterized protein with FMN-binding domain/NAD-dependent dihydropyrimidine dehydrogenase PreA subunit
MKSQKTKIKNTRSIRYGVQVLGILLTIIGIFSNYPMVNLLFFATAIIMGPVFCGWICPFGTMQDLFSRIGSRLGIKKRSMPEQLKKLLAWMRYAILLIITLISADFIFALLSLDPRVNLISLLGGNMLAIAGWIIMFGFLAISMFYDRPFCNYFCTEGAKYGLLSFARPLTIVRDEETCIGCNKCNRSCPMNIDVASVDQVRSIQCISCMECVNSCPVEGTLKLGLIPVNKGRNKLKMVFALAASLIIVYVGLTHSLDSNDMGYGSSSESLADSLDMTMVDQGDAAGVADGTYAGQGQGFRGTMTVEVTVEEELITSIDVTFTNDDDRWFDRAYDALVPNIISTQTVDIESVSGATYSSVGIKEGVANALIDAGGTEIEAFENELPESKGKRH